jgi:FixJ family two-component response regulator
LDDDADMLDAVSEAIEGSAGLTCLAVRSYAQLAEQESATLSSSVAILDINLGEGSASGIDAYQWLRGHDYGGRVIFLTGHALSHPLVRRATELGAARVVQKPVTLSMLMQMVQG